MRITSLIIGAFLSFSVSAQPDGIQESTQQQPAVSEDSISSELPAPLPEGTTYRPTPTATPSTRVELLTAPPSGNSETAQKLAGMGAGLYFAGLALSRGLALPLNIAANEQQSGELLITSGVIDLIATGFKISGTTRNGIGASLSHDVAYNRGLNPDHNINWGFCKAGWAFIAIGSISSAILNLGATEMDYGTIFTFSLITTSCGIANDIMWSMGVINALIYTKKTNNSGAEQSKISVTPMYSARQKSFGLTTTVAF
jgi:hypothetical protein